MTAVCGQGAFHAPCMRASAALHVQALGSQLHKMGVKRLVLPSLPSMPFNC